MVFKRKKNLIHIVYVSFSVNDLSDNQLDELLINIRKRNKIQEVTGLLLYNDGSFIQLIEGAEDAIKSLFEKIKKDTRHTNIVLLLEERIKKRAFPDWSMGYFRLSQEQMKEIPGYSDFLNSDDSIHLIESTTREAMKLLNSFKIHT